MIQLQNTDFAVLSQESKKTITNTDLAILILPYLVRKARKQARKADL